MTTITKNCAWCGEPFKVPKSGFASRRLWCKPECKKADYAWRYEMENGKIKWFTNIDNLKPEVDCH